MQAIERETDPHRIAKAQAHSRRGEQLREERLAEGLSWEKAQSGLLWHHHRAVGQIQRFERIEDCGQESYWLTCTDCRLSQERKRKCKAATVCRDCRQLLQQEKRAKFRIARTRSLALARDAGFLSPRDPNRWSEKLLTLTAPHCPEHGVRQRIEFLFAAWQRFLQALNRFFLRVAGKKDKSLVAWFRAFEWTAGRDFQGHPHFHVWLLCPLLDPDEVRGWWRNALRSAGYSKVSTTRPIVDIRRVKDGDGATREVIKYLTKDILPDRRLVPAGIFARVYETLDGRRITQASAKFFAGLEKKAICPCGAVGCLTHSTTRPETDSED